MTSIFRRKWEVYNYDTGLTYTFNDKPLRYYLKSSAITLAHILTSYGGFFYARRRNG